jgi:hypothetical protein
VRDGHFGPRPRSLNSYVKCSAFSPDRRPVCNPTGRLAMSTEWRISRSATGGAGRASKKLLESGRAKWPNGTAALIESPEALAVAACRRTVPSPAGAPCSSPATTATVIVSAIAAFLLRTMRKDLQVET